MIDCDTLEQVKATRSNDVLPNTIDPLIADLGSSDGLVRQNARIALIRMGEPAVGSLITALQNKSEPTHWEAAKALKRIGTPDALAALEEWQRQQA